jgi:hypothetical protein
VRKTERNYGRRSAAIMIRGGWECIVAEELAIKKRRQVLEKGGFWGASKERVCCERGQRQMVPEDSRMV